MFNKPFELSSNLAYFKNTPILFTLQKCLGIYLLELIKRIKAT